MSKMLAHAQLKENARKSAKALESKYKAGDINALLDAVSICSLNKVALPKWAVKALGDQIHRARTYRVASWDDIFGKPLKKGQHLNAARKEWELMRSVPYEMWTLTKHEGLSLTDAYRVAAKTLGSNETTVRQIYYKVQALLRAPH